MRFMETAVAPFLGLCAFFSNTSFASTLCQGTFLSTQTVLFEASPGEQNGAQNAKARRFAGLWVVEQTLAEAHAQGRNNIITLKADASFDDPTFESTPLTTFEPESNDTLVRLMTLTLGGIGTSGGSKVTVRAEQPVLNPYGELTRAVDVRLGQSLVKANGNYGLVRAIEKRPSYDDLFVLGWPQQGSERTPMLVSGEVLVGMPGCEP